MDRTTAANSVGALPAYAGGAVGYHADKVVGVSPGTTISADHQNMITEELRHVVTDAGLVPSATNDHQVAAAIPILAQLSASQNSQTSASGVALASSGANASGARVAILASQDGAGDCKAQGTETALVATNNCTVDGLQSGIVASQDSTTLAAKTNQFVAASKSGDVTEGEAALIATENCTASGQYATCIGSLDSTASGQRAHVIGSNACVAGEACSTIDASRGCETYAAGSHRKVILASLNSVTRAGNNSILLASEGARLDEGNVIAAGYSNGAAKPANAAGNLNLTFKIDVTTGNVTADGTYTSPAADYAECFPLVGADRLDPGFLVAGDGPSVRLAQTGDRIRGVTSATPNLVGNARDPGHRYQLDDWGRPAEVIGVRQERAGYDGTEGQNRQTAHGWATVALLGQVRVRVTGDAKVGDLLSACDGVGHPTQKPKGRPVEVLTIVSPFDAIRGYGIALCLVG